MNPYYKRLSNLFAIGFSVIALLIYPLLPDKRLEVLTDPDANIFLYGTNVPSGDSAAQWLNQRENQFRCKHPEGTDITTYYCSFNVGFDFRVGGGLDLSEYDRIKLSITYDGTAPKMRFFARNYSPLYSTPNDPNSAKYNAIFIATKDLKNELILDINDFVVTEWWLLTYQITRENSQPELGNIVNLGVDFSDNMTVGNHDLTINKIEFIGQWVSKESWYLAIIAAWLIGVFVTTVIQLRAIRLQTLRDRQTIDELNKHNKDLINESDRFKKLSTLDALTQSYNRFGIDQIVSTLMNSAKNAVKDKPTFSLVLLDIDHFKRVNDRYAHDVGDEVLQKVSTIIKSKLRANDYFGRWGGEEFIIILPFTTETLAFELAEKIRQAVIMSNFSDQQPMKITVSLGVGDHLKDEDFSDVFKRVDEALYTAKNSGRNCTYAAEKTLKTANG